MDTNIKVKQEVLSELATQNETESFLTDLSVNNTNDTVIWYDGYEMGIKMEIKQEPPVTACNSEDERHLFTKDHPFTYSNILEVDTKTDVYSENERTMLPKYQIESMKECTSDCEIEIKQEPCWLERTTHIPSDCGQPKDGRNAAELTGLNTEVPSQVSAHVRKDVNLNARQNSFELKDTRECDDALETFSNEESLCSEHPAQNNVDSLGIALIQQNDSYGSDSSKNNITCKPSLVKHNLTDRCEKALKCDRCHKSFTQLSDLKQHSSDHEGVKTHRCEICEKTFTRLFDLKRHNLIHEGLKPHKCEICNKTYTRLSNLKQHNLLHEGAKSYKCEVCEKTFTHLSNLRRHNLLHEGVKSHRCEICDKAFTRMSHLKRHNLIHEGVMPYKCELCGKSFRHLPALKNHILAHEKRKCIQRCNV